LHPTNQEKEEVDETVTPVDRKLFSLTPTTTRAETYILNVAQIMTAIKSSSETMSAAKRLHTFTPLRQAQMRKISSSTKS